MKVIRLILWVSTALLQPLFLQPALAMVYINVDFQPGGSGGGTSVTFNARGAMGTPGTTWNAVAPSTDGSDNASYGSGGLYNFSGDPYSASALLDSTGTATRVGVEIFKGDPDGAFALNPLNGWDTNIAENAKELMRDYLISGYATKTNSVNITGLPAGSFYTLVLYGAGDLNDCSTKFTINGVSKATTGVPNDLHNLTEGEDYVIFTGITASGSVTIQYANNDESANGNFNGFQLAYVSGDSIPTLSEWGMIILAGLLLGVGAWYLHQRSRAGPMPAPS